MRTVKILEGIYNIGVIDWNIRDFHGYSTHQGTTYNAFLILGEKNILIDTVKKDFSDQLIENISKIIDPKKIDCVISNHTEMDHSGSLPRVMHKIGEEKPLYCSKMGEKNLKKHFSQNWNYKPVESGEELKIGDKTFLFLETRMLHWPDSMITYLKEEKILFSSDAFGQHYAGSENFDDEINEKIMPHAKKYFVNILLPFSALILKLIEKIAASGLEFKMICPDHGIVWRQNPQQIIDVYKTWAEQIPQRKASVIYDTMWHSTEKMAESIVSGLLEEGIDAKPLKLRNTDRSDIMVDVMDSKAVIIGSPTLNNGLFPSVADFLTYMKGLKPKFKIGCGFGSYGWSGEAVKLINDELSAMKFDVIDNCPRIQYVPDNTGIQECIEFGKKIGLLIKESV
ncbi:MAG: flavodoxin domain-containing protein [Desulfobacterales bacterium]|nr:flavodoxin domain-containing protein [Desulfobacterales bacterium]